jgi:hypothetical protein
MIFWVRFIKKTNIATNELVISNLIQSNQALIVKVVLQNAGTVSQKHLLAYLNFVIYFLEGDGLMGDNVQLLKSSSTVLVLLSFCFIAMIKVLKLVFCISYQ